jgi:hypothetical protein
MASNYPTSLDTFATNKADATTMATDHATHHNDLADAVNKVEAELGTDPSGASSTVKARLDAAAAVQTRIVDEKLNVEHYGAHPSESAANNRTYIQAAIDAATAAPTGTRKIFFPRLYQIDSTGLLINEHGLSFEGTGAMNGNASLGSGVYSQTGDVFKIGTTTGSVWHLWFRDMCIGSLAGGGHLFVPQSTTVDQGINQGGMERCLFWQDNNAKSIWRQTAGILLDWKVSDCTHNHTQGATVHAWHMESTTGQLNEVRFVGGRVNNSGTVQTFYLAAIGGGWQDAARFEDINFEVPTGGCIKLLGCWAPVLENLQVWDLGTFGAPISNNDMFWLGYQVGSDDTRYPSLKNIWRYGTNSLTAGTVDVRFQNVRGGVIENCGGLNNAMSIDLAGAGTAGELVQLTNLSPTHTTLTNTAGKVGEYSPPRIASVATAATIAAPVGVQTMNLTGTTNVTSITAEPAGRTIEVVAGATMTLVDGSNLALDSDYAMTSGDSITLRSDGTNWRELSRSESISPWVTLMSGSANLTGAAAAATYIVHRLASTNVTAATANWIFGADAFRIDTSSIYVRAGSSVEWRIVHSLMTNTVDPGTGSYTPGLYPVVPGGAAGALTPTLGTVVTGSNTNGVAITNPTASQDSTAVQTTPFTIGTADTYVLAMVASAAGAANSAVRCGVQLQYRFI